MRYRRARIGGGTFFFTLTLEDRSAALLTEHIHLLTWSLRRVRHAHPFETLAMAVMPDHLHAIWRLPDGDSDFPMRWALIKAGFSRNLPRGEFVSASRARKRERGLWQRRYWEHAICSDADLANHIQYIHFNPVKHGYVCAPEDWPYSTVHRVGLDSPTYQPNLRITTQPSGAVE